MRRKGMHTGATIEQLDAMRAVDAYNAGYNSVGRGHSGDESRYAKWRTANDADFQRGRRAAETGS